MWLDHITSSGLGIDAASMTSLSFATSSTYAPTADRTRFVRGNPTRACAQLSASRPATLHPLPGDNSCVEPPDPIPNSEVKRTCADGSVHLACESRSSPGSYPKTPQPKAAGFFFVRIPLARIDTSNRSWGRLLPIHDTERPVSVRIGPDIRPRHSASVRGRLRKPRSCRRRQSRCPQRAWRTGRR